MSTTEKEREHTGTSPIHSETQKDKHQENIHELAHTQHEDKTHTENPIAKSLDESQHPPTAESKPSEEGKPEGSSEAKEAPAAMGTAPSPGGSGTITESRPVERPRRARGTAAMDPQTRKEVARKGGLAVSRNKQHMAEIGRKGGQSVSKNREHMAQIGRKGGAASRGHR